MSPMVMELYLAVFQACFDLGLGISIKTGRWAIGITKGRQSLISELGSRVAYPLLMSEFDIEWRTTE